LDKSTLSLVSVSFVIITIIIISNTVFTFKCTSSCRDFNTEIIISFLLCLGLNGNPIEVNVEVYVLFHLGQIHVVEISNHCNVWSNVQLINDIGLIKFEILNGVCFSLLELWYSIVLFSTLTLNVCGNELKLKVLSDIGVSFLDSTFVQGLVAFVHRNLRCLVICDHGGKLSNINVVVVVFIVQNDVQLVYEVALHVQWSVENAWVNKGLLDVVEFEVSLRVEVVSLWVSFRVGLRSNSKHSLQV